MTAQPAEPIQPGVPRSSLPFPGRLFFSGMKFFSNMRNLYENFACGKEKNSGGRGVAHNILWRMLRLPRNMGRKGLKCLGKQTFS